MPGRRFTVLVSIVVAVAGWLVWRTGQFGASRDERELARTVIEIARRSERPVAWTSEGEAVDQLIAMSTSTSGSAVVRVLPRQPDTIEWAVQSSTVLAGARGREFLEVLGYELWSVEDSREPSLRVFEVKRRLRCAAVGAAAWSPLPGLEYTGRLGIVLPSASNGSLAVIAGDEFPLDVIVTSADGTRVAVDRQVLSSVASAPPDYWIEGRSPHDAPQNVQRITLSAAVERASLVSMRFGRRAPRVLARLLDYGGGARATVCAAPIGVDPAFAGAARDFVVATDVAAHFGTGWSDELLEREPGMVRWMTRHGAVLVPFARRGTVRVTLRAYRRTAVGDGEVSLRINDVLDTAPVAVGRGLSTYEWSVPAGAWVVGTNEILIRATGAGDERLLGLQYVQLTLLD